MAYFFHQSCLQPAWAGIAATFLSHRVPDYDRIEHRPHRTTWIPKTEN